MLHLLGAELEVHRFELLLVRVSKRFYLFLFLKELNIKYFDLLNIMVNKEVGDYLMSYALVGF